VTTRKYLGGDKEGDPAEYSPYDVLHGEDKNSRSKPDSTAATSRLYKDEISPSKAYASSKAQSNAPRGDPFDEVAPHEMPHTITHTRPSPVTPNQC